MGLGAFLQQGISKMVDKNKRKGWEVVQWGNCLLHKPEDLTLSLTNT